MENLIEKQGLSLQQLATVNSEFEKRKKSKGAAFLLWFILGFFGAHRFYLGEKGVGFFLLAIWVIGWFTYYVPTILFWIGEAFFLSKQVNKINDKIEADIIRQVKEISVG